MLKISWTLLASAVAIALFMAPGPFEVSCNPLTVVASNSANAVQVGGVNSKREMSWLVAGTASNAIGFYVKLYDSNTAPTVNSTTPTAIISVGTTASNAIGPVSTGSSIPMQFITGMWVALTANITADNGLIAANNGYVTLCWN